MSRPEIVERARAWIGTPYVHQQSCKAAGCDCLGLLRGIWTELGGPDVGAIPAYTMDWSETSGIEVLWAAARAHLRPKTNEPAPGDVLLFRMSDRSVAKHLGIQANVGPAASFVHAYSGHGVMESPLSAPWQRRIVARFEFPTFPKERV